MTRDVLITGGAGFIGSHLADELLRHGCHVRVLDCLIPQVHGEGCPDYLNDDVELCRGDLRDPATLRRALDGRAPERRQLRLLGVSRRTLSPA